jgi:hypothetical protein
VALTYSYSNLYDLVGNTINDGVPIPTAQRLLIADVVQSEMWKARPWYRTLTTIAAGSLPCSDGVQDYSAPAQIYRLTQCKLVRTDTTPDDHVDLDVTSDLRVDLVSKSYRSISQASLQAAVGQIRLASAVAVPSGMTLEIQGQIQTNPTKITSLSQGIWWDDHTLTWAFTEGLTYWAYKIADDPRAGGIQKIENGRAVYTGQYAAFMDAIDRAASSEDFPTIDSFFPSEPLGEGRSTGDLNIFGVN